METKTIYVPVEQVVLLPEFLSVYHNGAGRIDLVKEDMVVMTKAEFEQAARLIWDNAIDYNDYLINPHRQNNPDIQDFYVTIETILK